MAYNSSYTGAQIDTALRDAEWYNLQCHATGVSEEMWRTRVMIIENYLPKLLGEQYRLVFMRQRRVPGKGLKWSIPMFGAIKETTNSMLLAQSFLPITGNLLRADFTKVDWSYRDFTNKAGQIRSRFLDTTNTRKKIGYAIFKRTGVGTFGWQRVSNIVGVEASIGNRKVAPNAKLNFTIFSE